MSKKLIELSLDLYVEAVTCPGVWLCQDGQVSLIIFALDSSHQTWRVQPVFPLNFQESFHFKKVFDKDCGLSEVPTLLQDEAVYCELVQWSLNYSKGKVLAQYLGQLSEMIFLPSMCSSDGIDLLMKTTSDYPGIIAPKIEIRSRVRIDQVCKHVKKDPPNSIARSKSPIKLRQRSTCHSPDYHKEKCQFGGLSCSPLSSCSPPESLKLVLPESLLCSSVSPELSRESSDAVLKQSVFATNVKVEADFNGKRNFGCIMEEGTDMDTDSSVSFHSSRRLLRSQPVRFEDKYPTRENGDSGSKSSCMKPNKTSKNMEPCNCNICERYQELFH